MANEVYQRNYHPYTGDYPTYGYQPEWNWFDYLNGGTAPQPGAPSQPAPQNQPSAPQPGPTPGQQQAFNPGPPAPSVAPSFDQPGRNNSNVPSSGNFHELQTGGVNIGYDKPAYGGLFSGGLGALTGLAGAFGPAGSLGSQAFQAATNPTGYFDTKPVNIPGVGPIATKPGALAPFMSVIPGALPISQLTGGIAMGNIANVFDTGEGVAGTLGPGTVGTYSGGPFGYNAVGVTGAQARQLSKELAKAYYDKKRAAKSAVGEADAARAAGHEGVSGTRGGPVSGSSARGGNIHYSDARESAAKNVGGYGGRGGNADRDARARDADRGAESRDRTAERRGSAEGGLVAYAEGGQAEEIPYADNDLDDIAYAGRGSDSEIAHVTPGELMLPPEFLRGNPGLTKSILSAMAEDGLDPQEFIVGEDETRNPETGLSEYGFFKKIKKIGKKVLPIGIGLGTSYLTGSDILGGLAGGVSSKLFGNSTPTAILTGLGTGIGSNILGVSDGGGAGLFGNNGALGFLNDGKSLGQIIGLTGGSAASAGDAAKSGGSGGGFDIGSAALPLLGAGVIGAGLLSQPKTPKAGAVASAPADNSASDVDPNISIDRQLLPTSGIDWIHLGEAPQVQYFDNVNPLADIPLHKASGGHVSLPYDEDSVNQPYHGGSIFDGYGQVSGPGTGQSDSINARLADGEYVIPADIVAHLGDGSTKAGGAHLDKAMRQIRQHKTKSGKVSGRKGKMPPKTRSFLEYLG